YENALVIELRSMGPFAEQQKCIPVFYEGRNVGDYVADLIVERKILVELKAAGGLTDSHSAVCMNYLVARHCPCACCSTSERHDSKLNAWSQVSTIRAIRSRKTRPHS